MPQVRPTRAGHLFGGVNTYKQKTDTRSLSVLDTKDHIKWSCGTGRVGDVDVAGWRRLGVVDLNKSGHERGHALSNTFL